VLFSASYYAAYAQPAARPPPVDPLQIERRIEQLEAEQRRAKKPPPPIPRLSQPDLKGAHTPLFRLESVSVKGAQAIALSALAAAYEPYIRREVSQYDLEVIASRVSDVYRQAGYHLSRAIIPPQDVKAGHLTVRVIEGAITEIQFTGDPEKRFGVHALLSPITKERPSMLGTVERQLLLANDIPGVRIADTALEEIGTTTGKFRLIVRVETWSIYVGLGLDNWGTFAVGPLQSYAATSFHSYLMPGDIYTINLSTVPDAKDDLRYGRAAYDVPVGDGSRIGVSASHSSVRPDDSRRALDTRIVTHSYELRGSVVPIASREMSLILSAALGFIDSSQDDLKGTTYSDRVRIVSLMANYRFRDQLDGWNFMGLVLRQGLGAIFGASESTDALLSREGASPSFSALAYSYTRHQQLSQAWSTRASVAGQVTSGPVLTSQAFYLGGTAFGPGYYSADNGVLGTAELRYEQPLNDFIKSYQFYAFIEGGVVWNTHGDNKQSLASTGVGVRVQLAHDLHAGVAFAVPLSYSSRTEEFRQYRVLFSLARALKVCPERPKMYCA
jgi:hemolysin activation/secretion protein